MKNLKRVDDFYVFELLGSRRITQKTLVEDTVTNYSVVLHTESTALISHL